MTCIVGIKDKQNNRVLIGADSIGVCNNHKRVRGENSKLFKIGDFLFGGSGDFRMMQITKHSFKAPKLPKNLQKANKIETEEEQTEMVKYLATDFAYHLSETFKEHGFDQKYEEGNQRGPYFILGYKNQLYQIEEDFQVAINKNGLYSIGSGSSYALGAMDILRKLDIEPEDKIRRALKVATKYCATVCKPFNVMST